MAKKKRESGSPFPITSGDHFVQNARNVTFWRNRSEPARNYLAVQKLIADGTPPKEACASVGIALSAYYKACNNHPAVKQRHDIAMEMRAGEVEEALWQAATGKACDIIEQYDAEGQLAGRQVRRNGVDVKAAIVVLKARKRETYGETDAKTGAIDVTINNNSLVIERSVQDRLAVLDAQIVENKGDS